MTTTTKSPVWYRAVDGSRYSDKDAAKIGPELAKLVRDRQAMLAADDIVEAARKSNSPLHRYFEWDDSTAAYLYREDQARHMIRAILVCWTDDREGEPIEESTRLLTFVISDEVPDDEEDEEPTVRPGRKRRKDKRTKRLVTFDKAAEDEAYAHQIIQEAAKDLKRFRDRYQWYASHLPGFKKKFRKVWNAINALG